MKKSKIQEIQKDKRIESFMILIGFILIMVSIFLGSLDFKETTNSTIRLDILPIFIFILGLIISFASGIAKMARLMTANRPDLEEIVDEREDLAIQNAQAKTFKLMLVLISLSLFILIILGSITFITFATMTFIIVICALYFLYHYTRYRRYN